MALLSGGCRDEVRVRLETTALPPDDVMLEVEELGLQSFGSLAARASQGDIDAARLLPRQACEGPCRALEVTLFVKNSGRAAEAPPVVRLSSPPGKPARQAITFTADEISPGRTGRIRFLVSLWPGEDELGVRLSGSVFLRVSSPSASAPSPVDEAPANPHRP